MVQECLIEVGPYMGLSEQHLDSAGGLIEDEPVLDSTWRVSSDMALR